MRHKAKHQPGQPLSHTCVHIQLHTTVTYIHLMWNCRYSRHSEQAVYTQFVLTSFPRLHPQPLSLLPQAMKAESWGLVIWLLQLSYYSEPPGCSYIHLDSTCTYQPPSPPTSILPTASDQNRRWKSEATYYLVVQMVLHVIEALGFPRCSAQVWAQFIAGSNRYAI